MSGCHICDGSLQHPGSPLHYSGVHNVWACSECTEILKTVPPKENDAHT